MQEGERVHSNVEWTRKNFLVHQVLGEVKENLDNTKDPKAIEAAIDDYCHSKKLHDKEKKLCYYLTPIKREVSGPMKFGVPTEKICQKLKKKSPEICELRYRKY